MGLMSSNFSMQHQSMPPCNYNSPHMANRPYITNLQNPSAPPTYNCGKCLKEVNDNDEALFCESSCKFFYHRFVYTATFISIADACLKFLTKFSLSLSHFSLFHHRICLGLSEAEFQHFMKDANNEYKCPKCQDQTALSPAMKLKSWKQIQSQLSWYLHIIIISFVFSQQLMLYFI